MKPIVDGLQADYGDRVAFLQLDAQNEGREAFAALKLRGHPSYAVVAAGGEVLWTATGQKSAQELQEEIADLLAQ